MLAVSRIAFAAYVVLAVSVRIVLVRQERKVVSIVGQVLVGVLALKLEFLELEVRHLREVIVFHRQPRVRKHLARRSPVFWEPLEDLHQEVGEIRGFRRLESVLISEHALQRKVLEAPYASKYVLASFALEKLVKILAAQRKGPRHGSKHLNHLGQVVVAFLVPRLPVGTLFPLAGVKQKVACDQLKDHARKRPEVCARVVVAAKHDFGAAILPRLNLGCKVVVRPTAISQVTNL